MKSFAYTFQSHESAKAFWSFLLPNERKSRHENTIHFRAPSGRYAWLLVKDFDPAARREDITPSHKKDRWETNTQTLRFKNRHYADQARDLLKLRGWSVRIDPVSRRQVQFIPEASPVVDLSKLRQELMDTIHPEHALDTL